MEFRFIPILMSVIVGVLLATTMLIPFITDATTTEQSFTNEGLWKMKPFETGDEWVMDEPGVWTLNGDSVLTTDNSASSVMIGDDWTVRGTGGVYGHTVYSATPASLTITVGETTTQINSVTLNSVEGYGVTNNGDYIVTKYDKPVVVHGDSTIWATGYTGFDGVSCIVHIEGTITDGVTVTCSTINNTSALSNFEITNLVINAEKMDKYVDTYELKGITFHLDCDYTTGGVTTQKGGDISYSSYVVPLQITADVAHPLDDAERTLIAVIPLLVIVGLIVGVAAVLGRRAELF